MRSTSIHDNFHFIRLSNLSDSDYSVKRKTLEICGIFSYDYVIFGSYLNYNSFFITLYNDSQRRYLPMCIGTYQNYENYIRLSSLSRRSFTTYNMHVHVYSYMYSMYVSVRTCVCIYLPFFFLNVFYKISSSLQQSATHFVKPSRFSSITNYGRS